MNTKIDELFATLRGLVSDQSRAKESLRAAEQDAAETDSVNSDLRTVNARLVADLAAAMERLNHAESIASSSATSGGSRLGGEGWMAVHMADMHRALLWMEHENRIAAREEGLGGWLSDHGGAMRQYDEEYRAARAKLTGESATGEVSDTATTGGIEAK
jgi:hypothetical protein